MSYLEKLLTNNGPATALASAVEGATIVLDKSTPPDAGMLALVEIVDGERRLRWQYLPEGIGGGPAEQLRTVSEAAGGLVLDIGPVDDGQVLLRAGSVVRGATLAELGLGRGNAYIDKPTLPHVDDDEFESGSPDLAARGFAVTNLDAAGAVTRVGPVLWHDRTGGDMTELQYRSTLAGGRLWLQLPAFTHQTYQFSKPATADGLGGMFAVKLQGSSMDEFTSEDRLRMPRWIYLTKAGQQPVQISIYSGFSTSQYVAYNVRGNTGGYNPRTYGDPSDVMQFDVLYANVSPVSGSLQSVGAINSANGLRYAANLGAAPGYHPDTMGFLVNGGSGDRASRIVEVDYLRRYPHGTWFGIA